MFHLFFANFLRLHFLFIPDVAGFGSHDVSNVSRIALHLEADENVSIIPYSPASFLSF